MNYLLRLFTLNDIKAFCASFPDAAAQADEVSAQFAAEEENGETRMFDRSNMDGHITASAFVLNKQNTHVLMIHHKFLGFVMSPGGHVERDDKLITTAWREANEETGVVPTWDIMQTPIDIDTHPIPANPAKNEGAHRHHDFIYVFHADSDLPLVAQDGEVTNAEWVAVEDIESKCDPRMLRVWNRIQQYKVLG